MSKRVEEQVASASQVLNRAVSGAYKAYVHYTGTALSRTNSLLRPHPSVESAVVSVWCNVTGDYGFAFENDTDYFEKMSLVGGCMYYISPVAAGKWNSETVLSPFTANSDLVFFK